MRTMSLCAVSVLALLLLFAAVASAKKANKLKAAPSVRASSIAPTRQHPGLPAQDAAKRAPTVPTNLRLGLLVLAVVVLMLYTGESVPCTVQLYNFMFPSTALNDANTLVPMQPKQQKHESQI